MTWVVTGGAGYIGAHVVRALQGAGMDVAVVDDLSTGFVDFVPADVPLLRADVGDVGQVAAFLTRVGAAGVVHVAGYKFAGESVREPLHTYRVNVRGTLGVLEAMERAGVPAIVFSSSAAVYGTPDVERVTEATATAPESPYGESKLIGEWLLADQGRATGLRHTSLRYFNVVGSADPALSDTSPHNLFPLVFRALDRGERPRLHLQRVEELVEPAPGGGSRPPVDDDAAVIVDPALPRHQRDPLGVVAERVGRVEEDLGRHVLVGSLVRPGRGEDDARRDIRGDRDP